MQYRHDILLNYIRNLLDFAAQCHPQQFFIIMILIHIKTEAQEGAELRLGPESLPLCRCFCTVSWNKKSSYSIRPAAFMDGVERDSETEWGLGQPKCHLRGARTCPWGVGNILATFCQSKRSILVAHMELWSVALWNQTGASGDFYHPELWRWHRPPRLAWLGNSLKVKWELGKVFTNFFFF